MIAFLKGRIESIEEGRIILDVGGVGYEVFSTLGAGGQVGDEIKVHTYMSVREDGVSLYGFISRESLMLFKMLIGVSGIGPKAAQGILSVMTPDDLRYAILSGDTKAISKAPGVGKKSAERVILDLKDKLVSSGKDADASTVAVGQGEAKDEGAAAEAAEALTALGYSATEAYRAVKAAEALMGEGKFTASELLKNALKQF